MAYSISPEIYVTEQEVFNAIPSFLFSAGAIVGTFGWGPNSEAIMISDEKNLVQRFAKPITGFNTETWHTAADFLKYSNALFVININDGVEATANVSSLGSYGKYIIDSSKYSSNSANGIDAKFEVTKDSGVYSVTSILNDGEGYELGDTFAILGSFLGGSDGTNDLTITVEAIDNTGEINDVSVSGTASDTDYSSHELANVSAKYPGTLGNSLKLVICNTDTFDTFEYNSFFGKAPDSNHVHIVLIDSKGAFSGEPGAILQIIENISLVPGAKLENGTNNYILDVLELASAYFKFTGVEEDWITALKQYFIDEDYQFNVIFENGTNGSDERSFSPNQLMAGYDLLVSKNELLFSYILMGKTLDSFIPNYVMENICEKRKDCIAFISPPKETTVDNPIDQSVEIVNFRNTLRSSSYGVLDSGYKYIYDKYNDRYEWIPLNCDIAGLCARTPYPWISPAGYDNGFIKNIIKLAFNPDKADRDTLYADGVNPVITQTGQGTLLFGDKTLLNRPSAFDRINVRRLFIAMSVSISLFSNYALFEFNNEYTRQRFSNIVNSFLRRIEGRNGIYNYEVVCDERNNTPRVIDQNAFVADIYVKPAKSINFIKLSLTSINSDVELEEYVTRFQ